MATRKAAKKKGTKKASKAKISATNVRKLRQTVKADELSKTVAEAVNRALAGRELPGIRGPILCGIIWRPDTGTFTPVFRAQ